MSKKTDTQKQGRMPRRKILRGAALGSTLPLLSKVSGASHLSLTKRPPRKIMVLGVDGMDPELTRKLMGVGRLPNCAKLAKMGGFDLLGTTYPPQSPVAWSSFVSGTNPGGHGIFDFIARDPESRAPYLSTSKTEATSDPITVGNYSFSPGQQTKLLREGPALWDILAEAGMDSVAFRAPVNFPAPENGATTLTGITTPDIQGSYGIFSFYTTDVEVQTGEVPGGTVHHIFEEAGRINCYLEGPVDPHLSSGNRSRISMTVFHDEDRKTALFEIEDQRLILKEGEWSDWVTLQFPITLSFSTTSAICRLYLKKAGEIIEFYVSPFNIDPKDPVAEISSPRDFAARLSDDIGDFYTQGMPEDTSALSAGVFSDAEFLEQSWFVLEERLRMLDHQLERFEEGFFYFYFSSLDLNSHAFWRTLDHGHPLYSEKLKSEFGDVLPSMYEKIDEGIGRAMEMIDEETLFLVVSDHGFVPFRRQFNLNSWLLDHGYSKLKNRFDREAANFFENTNWSETKAYGLGINSLYINTKGRESDGIVESGDEFEKLREELKTRLSEARDPDTGERIIRGIYRPDELYSGEFTEMAPDLVVCYNEHYRASWDTILGGYPQEVVTDNLDPWSGDHCMHPDFLSGVFLCNRSIDKSVGSPKLWDIAPTILHSLSIEIPKEMSGKILWK